MSPWAITISVLALGIVFYPGNIIRFRRMRAFYRRPSAEAQWQVAFPNRSRDEVECFLRLFVNAFSIAEKHWRAFRPDDPIDAIYRALNPAPWNMQVDSMEYEIFDKLMARRFKIHLNDLITETSTLGEVFSLIKPITDEMAG